MRGNRRRFERKFQQQRRINNNDASTTMPLKNLFPSLLQLQYNKGSFIIPFRFATFTPKGPELTCDQNTMESSDPSVFSQPKTRDKQSMKVDVDALSHSINEGTPQEVRKKKEVVFGRYHMYHKASDLFPVRQETQSEVGGQRQETQSVNEGEKSINGGTSQTHPSSQ